MLEKGVSARPSFFRLLGTRVRAFAALPSLFFSGHPCLGKAPVRGTYQKPMKNQWFWPLLVLLRVLPGASFGALGAAWGRPGGSQRGAWRVHFCLGRALGVFGANLSARGPDDSPCKSIFVPFWGHFGVRADVFLCCVFVSFR